MKLTILRQMATHQPAETDVFLTERRLLDWGYYKNVITIAPSLEISRSEMDLTLAALDVVIIRAKQQLAANKSG